MYHIASNRSQISNASQGSKSLVPIESGSPIKAACSIGWLLASDLTTLLKIKHKKGYIVPKIIQN